MRHPRARSLAAASAAMLLGVTALTGCGVTRGDQSRDILMIIPNSPGGGYDQTGRAAVQVMVDDDVTGGDFTVDNVDRRRRRRGHDHADGQGRRRAHDDDGRPRRGGLALLVRQRLPPERRQPARPADERAGRRPGAGRLAVRDDRRPGAGLEGRPVLDRRRWRVVARRARPPVPDAARADHRRRPQRRQLRLLRRRRAADERVARREDRGRLLGAGGVRGSDRGRRAAGARRLRRGAPAPGRVRRHPDADRVGHRPGVPQLARRARAARASATSGARS